MTDFEIWGATLLVVSLVVAAPIGAWYIFTRND
jgi:hypothetical protein